MSARDWGVGGSRGGLGVRGRVGEGPAATPHPPCPPSLAADVDIHCFSHEGFGAGGGLRPEALVQVALQVAFYRYGGGTGPGGAGVPRGGGAWGVQGGGRVACGGPRPCPPPRAHGSLCASCEPTALRHVLPGCSDLLRPPGPPCLALAHALDDPHASVRGAGGGAACPGGRGGGAAYGGAGLPGEGRGFQAQL